MKTLKGYEAIEVAERHGILLYDLLSQNEVTAPEARDFIRTRGNANSCVIEAWPDTEEEAEQIVLKAFQRVLSETRRSRAALGQLFTSVDGKKVIHPKAVELAADRLVEQGRLVVGDSPTDNGVIYSIPRTIYFADEFLDKLSEVVCEECARFDIVGAFHEDCLLQLIDFIKSYDFSLDDLRESDTPAQPRGNANRSHVDNPVSLGIGRQWLQRTANATRTSWKTVLKPMFKHRESQGDAGHTEVMETLQNSGFAHTATAKENMNEATEPHERPQITKDELIRYLHQVEILDDGELNVLQMETENLRKELAHKESEIRKMEQQRTYLESQFGEMQRDMDTLIRAMRIAKRYEPNQGQVFDATYQSEVEEPEEVIKIQSDDWRKNLPD